MPAYRTLFLIIICQFHTSIPELNARDKKPKGVVSYSILLIMNEKSEVLLLRRKNGFGAGLYSLPGGKIESGETALEAAKREAKEEIGIHVEGLALVHVVDRQNAETEFYVFVFKPRMWSGGPINCEPNKCDDIGWFNVSNLPENILPAHRQAIELNQKGIAYSEHGWVV